MNGRRGCCIARYAGGAYDKSKADRIMLRFRPIAPKPAVGREITGSSTPEKKDSVFKAGRAKRRYVRDSNKRCNRKRRVFSEEKKDGLDDATGLTLLPLLPEMPDRKETPASPSDLDLKAATSSSTSTAKTVEYAPIWFNFKGPTTTKFNSGDGSSVMVDRTVVMPPVGSLVTVERVTEVYVDGEGLGYTDEERRKNLEKDTCPGFISDGMNRVEWINEAYRRMIGEREREGRSADQMVSLVTKDMLLLTCPAFACRVRLQYTCQKERQSLTMPCDVWRMEGGGFAWRLDVKAALSLGPMKNRPP